MIKALIANSFVGLAVAHSWADNVGGGSYRGAQGANDLIKQRYYCPSSLDQCKTPPNSGVVLTAENLRPCRTDFPTPSWGSAVAGEQMYVHWAGNGHTGAQAVGTCVSIYITPYALDPDFGAFRQLAGCLPYSHNGDMTDAFVTIPADLASGRYTVFWMWDFAPFWFSSCSDINVVGNSGPTAPATTASLRTTAAPVPVTTGAPAPVTVAPVPGTTAPVTPTAAPGPVSASDCKGFDRPNAECQAKHGGSSFCVSWVMDKCGRSQCSGAPPMDDSKC
jgi:hypothetical protein